MTKRFRMIAGPNGSAKSTLTALLCKDCAVNFYTYYFYYFSHCFIGYVEDFFFKKVCSLDCSEEIK